MAKKLRPGSTIHGYTITDVFGPGAFAISYAAETATGEKCFFKQYKSPSITVDWYGDYVAYQQELHRRIQSGPAARFCVRLIEAFEEVWGGPTYFQAYELIERGADLRGIFATELDDNAGLPLALPWPPEVWQRHVTWARVLMAAIAAVHEAGVAHCDLKPENVFLIEDPSIGAGFQLKLVDMDFSVLTDRRAPWHGQQGYVGTPDYLSPEHLCGDVPGAASDVFTCGLILYELLTGTHPYASADPAEYAEKVRTHAAPPPALAGPLDGAVADMLHRCLAPDAARRPSAVDVRDTLRAPAPASAAASRTSAAAAAGVREPLTADRVRLTAESGAALDIGIRTTLGKRLCQQFGSDAEYWDSEQCVLQRSGDGQWRVVPIAETTNETLIDGEPVHEARPLRDGDVIAVGRASKGIAKLPLTLRNV